MFKAAENKVDFPKLEEKLLDYWEEKNIFKRSTEQRNGNEEWVFYDGPPGTNGKPHVGHMMQSALKDLFCRYKVMKGYLVLRKAGWDTHGLPVELTAEKDLHLKSKRDIEKYGVEKYIEYCRNIVFRYRKEWDEAIRRSGRFIDLENAYATLTDDYIQSDWWTIKSVWNPSAEMREKLGLGAEESLLYKSHRISPYCPRCGTTLSNFETAQGYKDTTDFALFPKFRDADDPNLYYTAWTTTAWTLLSNVALAAGPGIDYVTLQFSDGKKLILAEKRLEALADRLGEYEIIDRCKGNALEGRRYIPLWEFLAKPGTNAHKIITDEYVTVEDGTGMVHLAAYGEDDFRIIKNHDLPFIQNVDENGECHAGQFSGRYFKDATLDVDIIKDLAHNGLLLHKEKHEHSYPFCFRCDSALMYFPRASWFIRTSGIKEKLLQANDTIDWYPAHIKHGRFGKWLENNVDWNITRERYWGSPLPIWTCEKCDSLTVTGSITELNQEYHKAHGADLPENFDPHKPGIDKIELKCDCGGIMKRENFVLDSWFNAGIMPWGQFGYPATEGSVDLFNRQFPGDFICEAIDQTRGWFYTMLAVAVLVKGESSYKNVICTELILDAQGHKMSKSRGNVVHPMAVFEKFGADAFRWVFFRSNPWTVKSFSDELMVESLRRIMIPLWNAYSFFVTYANVDGWQPDEETVPGRNNRLDCWIISEFQRMNKKVTAELDVYNVAEAAASIEDFIDYLTNWYIRRSRRRFWKSENDDDKSEAYNALYYVLLNLSRILAPFLPFLAEEIYLNLVSGFAAANDSVHLDDFPQCREEYRDTELEKRMNLVREAVTVGRSLRNDAKLKIRQPLAEIKIISKNQAEVEEMADIIKDELNVKQVSFIDDDEGLITRTVKPNFKLLGPKFGPRMKDAKAAIEAISDEQIGQFLETGSIELLDETVTSAELIVEESAGEGVAFRRGAELSVALDVNLTEELIAEGYAREFVNKVQNLRKDSGLNITDRIELAFSADDSLTAALLRHEEFICREVLAVKFERVDKLDHPPLKINDKKAIIYLQKSI